MEAVQFLKYFGMISSGFNPNRECINCEVDFSTAPSQQQGYGMVFFYAVKE